MSGGPLKSKFLVIVSLGLLVAGPCYGERRHSTSQPVTATDNQAAPTLPPPTLAQQPATPPQVSFQGGQLTISAQNSTLGDILKAVRAQTGATIDLPGTASERVIGNFGPGPARDVLTALLNGSHFNYVLLGSSTDPGALDRVILMAKSGGSAESNPPPAEQATAYNQTFPPRPIAPMAAPPQPAPGGNTVVVEGQDAQDDATDDTADATTDDAQADDQTDPNQADDQAATDDQQQQNGQPNVKTPEQLLQELQQRQQQIQQGIQPGVPPGMPNNFPNPGAAGPGDAPNAVPPHN